MASSANVNQWNEQWRSSPLYQEAMRFMGIDTTKPIKLSDKQREFVQSFVEQKTGVKFDNGLEIDPAGNMNENEGLGKQVKKWGPLVGGAALTLFGIPGVVPGLLSGGGAGVTAATGAAFDVPADSAAGIASMAGSGVGAGTFGAAGANMGWGSVLDFVKNPKNLAGIGSALTRGSETSASNRGSQIEAMLAAQEINDRNRNAYNNDVTSRDIAERAAQKDAWKQMQQSQYVQNWKPQEARFSPYSKPLVAPTAATMASAGDLSHTSSDRLAGRTSLPEIVKPMPFSIPGDLTKGSMWEKLMGYAGAGLGGYGAIKTRTA